MKASPIVLLLLAWGLWLGGCDASERTLLVVSIEGLPPDAATLRVTTTVAGQRGEEDFPGMTSRFGLWLPAGAAGPLSLGIVARGPSGCRIGSGTGSLVVADEGRSEGRIDVVVPMRRIEPALCGVTVLRTGDGAGVVRSEPAGLDCGARCAAEFPLGSTVDLAAVPDAASVLSGWSGACSGTGPCRVLIGPGPMQVMASFGRRQLTVVVKGNGTITSEPPGIDCGVTCSHAFAPGTRVRLRAQAGADARFNGFSGACQGAVCELEFRSAGQVSAFFGPKGLCPFPDWCWEDPVPFGDGIFSISGTGSDDVWIGGSEGRFYRWDGARLMLHQAAIPNSITGLWLRSKDQGFAVSRNGQFLRWDGASWTLAQSGLGNFGSLWGGPALGPWVVGSNGIWQWNGTRLIKQDATPGLLSIWGTSESDLWAAGLAGTLLRYDGTRWTPMPSGLGDNLASIWGSAANDLWMTGQGGRVLHYDGVSLTASQVGPVGSGLLYIWGSGPKDAWLAGVEAALHFDGAAWTQVAAPRPTGPIWGAKKDDLWAASEDGLLRWDGSAWGPVTRRVTGRVGGMWGTSPRDVWAVGNTFGGGAQTLHHFDGESWRQVDTGVTRNVEMRFVIGFGPDDVWAGFLHRRNGIWASEWPDGVEVPIVLAAAASGPKDLWAVGLTGVIVHWDGVSFRQVPSCTTADLSGVWSAGPDDAWAVGTGGAICRWDGTAWRTHNSGTTMDLRAVWGSGPADVWVTGDRTLRHWDGAAWSSVYGGPLSGFSIWGTGPTDVWIVGSQLLHWDGAAFRVDPGGGFWIYGTDRDNVWLGSSLYTILRRR